MKKIDMTQGSIGHILFILAMPVIFTNFFQISLGMIDMFFIGKVGKDAIAAVGTASFFINLALALESIVVIGTSVRVAQNLGAKKNYKAKVYIKNSIFLSIIISLFFSLIVYLLSYPIIGFFQLGNPAVEKMANDFLLYSLLGVPFMFLTMTLAGIMTSYGNTKLTFIANIIGVGVNIILDPLFIFGFGFIPSLGVSGAAIATTISRIIILLVMFILGKEYVFVGKDIKLNASKMIEVIKMSLPITLQNVIFMLISMVMAKIIVRFGTDAIAVQKVGIQVESITWMTIGGIQGAIAAFIGQNYGAKKYKRIKAGYKTALFISMVFGLVVSILFVIFAKEIFSLFAKEPEIIAMGAGYMKMLGYAQIFMCMEILTVGAFNGLGKTKVPPTVSITFSLLRIPLALILSKFIGLDGIWMSISISMFIKGILLVSWYLFYTRKYNADNLFISVKKSEG